MNERLGILSCSALPRVGACLASVPLSEGVAEVIEETTQWAEDGDAIHAAAVASLMGVILIPGMTSYTAAQLARGLAYADRCRQMAAKLFGDTEVQWVCEQRAWAFSEDGQTRLLSGRWDVAAVTIHRPRAALVIDLKSGPRARFSVPPAGHNLQLAGYALLVAEEFDAVQVYGAILADEHETCEPVLIPSTRETSPIWPVVLAAHESKGKPWWDAGSISRGEHCLYCPAKTAGRCPAHRDALATVLSLDAVRSTIQAVDDETLLRAKEASETAKALCRVIDQELERRVKEQGQVGEWVMGRSAPRRTVTDAWALAQRLAELGVESNLLTSSLSMSIGDATKAFSLAKGLPASGKRLNTEFSAFAGDLISLPEGSPKLVRKGRTEDHAE